MGRARHDCTDPRGSDEEILAELVYERVRAAVNLCQLVILERDLEQSIERALGDGDEAAAERARDYIAAAWARLEDEWSVLRERT